MSDPIDFKRNRAKALLEGNERSYAELVEFTQGKFIMDGSDVRREMFYEMLVEWGVITEEQMLDFEIKFHEKVEAQLDESWKKYRAAAKPHLTVAKKPTKLLGLDGRPLS